MMGLLEEKKKNFSVMNKRGESFYAVIMSVIFFGV